MRKKSTIRGKYYETKPLFKDDYSILSPWAIAALAVVIVALLCIALALLTKPEFIFYP